MAVDFEITNFKDDEEPAITAGFLNKLQQQTKTNLENIDNKEVSGTVETRVARTTVSANTTITDGYRIVLPINYKVGNNSLALFWNGVRLTKATDTEDGHYKESGTVGELSNEILMHRTTADGNYTLPEDITLTVVVQGVNDEGGAVG